MSRSDSGVTLQINSIGALERLLGGDQEFFVSIRKAVAEQFAADHLKQQIEREFTTKIGALNADIAKEVKAYALKQSSTSTAWSPQFELTPDVKDKVKTAVRDRVGELVNAEVEKHRASIKTVLDAAVDKLIAEIPQMVSARITHTFNKEVNAAVDARLREIKSLLPLDPPESRKITIP